MERFAKASSKDARYYVINNTGEIRVKVSEEFSSLRDAKRALEQLRKRYPFARLAGTRD